MYAVYKNNRKAVKKVFDSYEEARQQARKIARAMFNSPSNSGRNRVYSFVAFTPDSSQVKPSAFGLEVRKVA